MLHSEGTFHLIQSFQTEKLSFKEHMQFALWMVGLEKNLPFSGLAPCLVGTCLAGRAQARISAPHLSPFNQEPCAVHNLYSPIWQLPPACLVFLLCLPTCIHKPLFSVLLPLPKHLLGYNWVWEMMNLQLGV